MSRSRRVTDPQSTTQITVIDLPFTDPPEFSDEVIFADQIDQLPLAEYAVIDWRVAQNYIPDPDDAGSQFRPVLPDHIEQQIMQWSDDITACQWKIGRLIADYLEDMHPEKREALRPAAIKEAAIFAKRDSATIREWVRTCEVIPHPVEHTPRFAVFGFNHFARAARMGKAGDAVAVLDEALRRSEANHPNVPPSCALIDDLVAEFKARAEGADDEEIDRRRAALEARARFRFSAQVVYIQSLKRHAIIIPPEKDFTQGDAVLVIRQTAAEV